MSQRRGYSRAEQKERVLSVFVENIQNGGDGKLTMNYIARQLGLVPSQHVTDILHELHVAGELIVEWEMRPGRWAGRMWWLANDARVPRVPDGVVINGKFYEYEDLGIST